jgi:hypothetical protein
MASQPKEPLQLTHAEAPMDHIAVDLFEVAGQHYLVMVDRFSGFPFVQRMRTITSAAIIHTLRNWFLDWGFPRYCRSDNGPQFRTEFLAFCEKHYIKHETSSPYNSQSNGLAEAAVKNVKRLLLKCKEKDEDFAVALSEWRNTPRADAHSPAQLFLGRRTRGLLPTLSRGVPNSDKPLHTTQMTGLPLNKLDKGDIVYVQNPISKLWNAEGVIAATHAGRSYDVCIDGTIKRRNRRFLRLKVANSAPDPAPSADSTEIFIQRRSKRLASRKKKVHFESNA